DLLLLQVRVHRALAVQAQHDRGDPERDQDRRCDYASDLEKLAHVPTPFCCPLTWLECAATSTRRNRGGAQHGCGMSPEFIRVFPEPVRTWRGCREGARARSSQRELRRAAPARD